MPQNKKYYIWGTGRRANAMYQYYKEELMKINLIGYIDNDLTKQGLTFHHKKVYSPEILKKDRESFLIIAVASSEQIMAQIQEDYPWYSDRVGDIVEFHRLMLISRYEGNEDEEICSVIEYLRNHQLEVFNYSFTEKYKNNDYCIEFDEEKDLYFVMHYGKKMFFSRIYKDAASVREYYKSILIEQDEVSPHRYLDSSFDVQEDSVVIDAGVGEGNFSLSVIDRVKKIYMFEPDENWIEALEYTFAPYKEKVEIINKKLSDYSNDFVTTIDESVKDDVDFIKMDIEGEEYYALKGAEKVIASSENIKCVICTYHQEFAYPMMEHFFETRDFNVMPTKGYMYFPSGGGYIMRAPELRRGLIRARKRSRMK